MEAHRHVRTIFFGGHLVTHLQVVQVNRFFRKGLNNGSVSYSFKIRTENGLLQNVGIINCPNMCIIKISSIYHFVLIQNNPQTAIFGRIKYTDTPVVVCHSWFVFARRFSRTMLKMSSSAVLCPRWEWSYKKLWCSCPLDSVITLFPSQI